MQEDTMGLARYRTGLVALTLAAATGVAAAAEVRVLSVGSTQHAAKALAADFAKQSGHQVTFTITPPFNIDKELAAKTFDAIIISVPAMETHDQAGTLVSGTRVALARVGVGVIIKAGAPAPDVSTPEKFMAAVLAARALTHGDPKLANTAGAIAAAAFAKLGILDEVKGKTRHATLAVGGKLVADGEVEIGFFNMSELPGGVALAGPLPGPLQGYTSYEAAVLAKGSKDEAAATFVKFLASPGAAGAWEKAKLEPASSYQPTRASR
jgi:molybdate transport system substrate-binding protein